MTPAAPSSYLLGADDSERGRLLAQGEMFAEETAGLLARVAPPQGGRAVDVGCGPLGVLDLLSRAVGPHGAVVGLDAEPRMLEMARRTLAERDLHNVELVLRDAGSSGLEPGGFDLVHTRLLLMNVPHSDAVLSEMAALVRPGGKMAIQDVDWMTRVCVPEHPAWDRVVTMVAELWRLNGMDVYIGRKLPAMLRAAGFRDVGVTAHTRTFGPGDPYQTLMVDRAELCRAPLVERGLTTDAELSALLEKLRAHLEDPGTNVVHATLFQAWGTRPLD
ncbi:methyltransferase domain-containing protein [Actinacidiphila paucisporea]|uniref:Ubiquinone/menaquinone biosynthesis C-methylase UbiE n=1 Tax=Actinacidiphila paucisporea TaxID=310782 RepID=A0A1M7Q9D9_9ACTN|nr:methyltransferase domain-containing protein [Actinacidiphila paucisporea]SHN27273.1 Ubiquinone/menaquinone biosynthesis C-methylase UbiE [Actinacidiphila paucisporea]